MRIVQLLEFNQFNTGSVHQMFQAQHVLRWRQQNPSGMVISHPECNFEVCKLSDYVGSTDFIIKTVAASAPGTRWLVGTELNLVNRIAEELKPTGAAGEDVPQGGATLKSFHRFPADSGGLHRRSGGKGEKVDTKNALAKERGCFANA